MPYENEHSARVRDPDDFIADSFRSKELPKSEGGKGGVRMIMGKLKDGDGSMVVQAYRFPTDLYTPAEAKKWLKDNEVEYSGFEPAKEEEMKAEDDDPKEGIKARPPSVTAADVSIIALLGRHAIKALDNWELDVLAVPYGGPRKGKDEHGEFFDAKSELDLEHYSTPAVHYYHGFDPDGKPQGIPEQVGEVKSVERKSDGVWYRIALNKTSKWAKRVWEAAKNKAAHASSGTIAHLRRIGTAGHIDYWPVVEISLFDTEGERQPANAYAVALPVMKALYAASGKTFPDDDTQGLKAKGAEQVPDVLAGLTSTSHPSKEVDVDEKELQKLISDGIEVGFKTRDTAAQGKADAEKAEKERTDAAIKAERIKWEAEAAKNRRLPFGDGAPGGPHIIRFGDAAYDHLDAGDMAVLAGVLTAAGKRPSEIAVKSLAAKLEGDKSGVGEMGRQAMKMAGIKANEIDYSTYASYGDEWIGIAYSQAIWEAIRMATFVANKLPTIEVPQGMESIYLPLESTDPIFYKVAEATAIESTLKIPQATVSNSPVGTGRVLLSLAKLGGRVIWSGEMEEGSLVPFVNQLRGQLVKAGGEYLESAIIDGDTETGASTNINDIDGTPASTDWFMVWNGFRKSALVTTTANSRSGAGSLDVSDYLETVKLMGTGGINGWDRSKVGFIVDVPTHYKTSLLPEVLTRDVFVNPTLEGGVLSGLFGYSLNASGQICKNGGAGGLSEATGKCDETAADNLYGQILAVRWDQWKFGWRRRMTIETTRIANADATEIVALMRCGLIQRDTEAVAATYYVGA